jgi:hypothetical protein
MVWYAAPAAAAPAEAFTLCLSLKAAQKLVAVPTETLVAFGEVALVAFGAVELVAFGAVELVAFGAVELVAFGDVDCVEPDTLLDPEEHPASTTMNVNMRESRRSVISACQWLVVSSHHNLAYNMTPAMEPRFHGWCWR